MQKQVKIRALKGFTHTYRVDGERITITMVKGDVVEIHLDQAARLAKFGYVDVIDGGGKPESKGKS